MPDPNVYRAFGRLRPKRGRTAARRPDYLRTFADADCVDDPKGESCPKGRFAA